ncbi:MAG: hypothetical protein ACI9MR_002320 [Myxococcota bacterium]|jgi:hypothetical protein
MVQARVIYDQSVDSNTSNDPIRWVELTALNDAPDTTRLPSPVDVWVRINSELAATVRTQSHRIDSLEKRVDLEKYDAAKCRVLALRATSLADSAAAMAAGFERERDGLADDKAQLQQDNAKLRVDLDHAASQLSTERSGRENAESAARTTFEFLPWWAWSKKRKLQASFEDVLGACRA